MTLLLIGLIVVDLFAVLSNYWNHKRMMAYFKEKDAEMGQMEARAYNRAVGKLVEIFTKPKQVEP